MKFDLKQNSNKIFLALILTVIDPVFAQSTDSVNGQIYSCNGSESVIDGFATCDDVPLDSSDTSTCRSDEKTICGFEKVDKHLNGGGIVSLCAKKSVSHSAYIDESSAVCGFASIDENVRIMNDSLVSGSTQISGKSVIQNSNLSGSPEILNSRVINSQISGASEINSSEIELSKISGSSEIENSTIRNSKISGKSEVDSSEVSNSKISGTSKVKNSTISDRKISGTTEIINEQD